MKELIKVLILLEKAEMLERMLNDTQDEIKRIFLTSKDEDVKRVAVEFAIQHGGIVKE